jgi:transposase InsO family protein
VHVVAVGDSDAGIAAALRARELDPSVDVSVVVADRYPNFSICGIPYHVSGDVPDWRRLAHCSIAELPAACLRLLLNTTASAVDVGVDETVPRRARINDSDALAVEINLFRHTYNHIRPHQALGDRTPQDAHRGGL